TARAYLDKEADARIVIFKGLGMNVGKKSRR
ncbi:MAG: hypothetical protein QOJ04_5035, partial [Caballeronia sp.]|nr:hypothetical protein [Caballeronia sp.]